MPQKGEGRRGDQGEEEGAWEDAERVLKDRTADQRSGEFFILSS